MELSAYMYTCCIWWSFVSSIFHTAGVHGDAGGSVFSFIRSYNALGPEHSRKSMNETQSGADSRSRLLPRLAYIIICVGCQQNEKCIG